MDGSESDVRELLSAKNIAQQMPQCQVHHLDITCDGCGADPIVGNRYRCMRCSDIDLCETCFRSIVAARISIQEQLGTEDLPAPSTSGRRGSNWIARVSGADPKKKWLALLETVPCLHRSHSFRHIRSGPERAIVFRMEPRGTCAEDGQANAAALNTFLTRLPPSKVMCSDAGWLHCVRGDPSFYTDEGTDRRIEMAMESWERLVEKSGGKVTAQNVDVLAKKHKLLSGKWMLFPAHGAEADGVWSGCTRAMLQGHGLGPCSEIKISTHSPRGTENKHVLLAYVHDYTNGEDVARAAAAIKGAIAGCGVRPGDARLLFKADIYSYLGVYAKNVYGLRPTIFEERL